MLATLTHLLRSQRTLLVYGLPVAFGALTFGLGPKLAYCAMIGM